MLIPAEGRFTTYSVEQLPCKWLVLGYVEAKMFERETRE